MSLDGVLALTLVVRDEAEILPTNLDFHLAQGVDVILVVDHGSSDQTPEILRDYEQRGHVCALREEDRAHDQAARVQRLLRLAATEFDARWVIHCDADEFWMPAAGSLRDVFGAVPDDFGYMIVPRSNFIPTCGDENRHFLERLRVRETCSLNPRGHPLEPKVAQRPAAGDRIEPGNHGLIDPLMQAAPDIGALTVLHYPSRSFAQFERKVLATGIGYELLTDREPGVGIDQLALLERHRNSELASVYAEQILDERALADGLRAGTLVVDERVAATLVADPPPAARSSPDVQQLLRAAWEQCAASSQRARAAEARAKDLSSALEHERDSHHQRQGDLIARLQAQEAELTRLRRDAEALSSTLDVIRSSMTMRATAPARRVYYRMRKGLRP